MRDELVRRLVVEVDETGVCLERLGHPRGDEIEELSKVEGRIDGRDRLGDEPQVPLGLVHGTVDGVSAWASRRAAMRPLTMAPAIHPPCSSAMSEPASSTRPGRSCPAKSPSLSQPGLAASQVPFDQGSSTQLCASTASTRASGT